MFIDSHAHLFNEDFGDEIEGVLERAREAGVDSIVVPGTNLETSEEAIRMAERHEQIYAAVGFHPHDAAKATDESLVRLEKESAQPKVVAIGEIGLDFHYDFSPREVQMEVFRKQMAIAVRRELPVIVHTRESMTEALEIVEELFQSCDSKGGQLNERPNGVFHCFTGTPDEALRLFDRGFFVSYPGMVTFKNSPVVATLKEISLERILIETDSPYLAPVPMRGKRNEPAYLVWTARKIAEVCNTTVDEVATITSRNARSLFGLDRFDSAHRLRKESRQPNV